MLCTRASPGVCVTSAIALELARKRSPERDAIMSRDSPPTPGSVGENVLAAAAESGNPPRASTPGPPSVAVVGLGVGKDAGAAGESPAAWWALTGCSYEWSHEVLALTGCSHECWQELLSESDKAGDDDAWLRWSAQAPISAVRASDRHTEGSAPSSKLEYMAPLGGDPGVHSCESGGSCPLRA